jgi:hypothetical protein
VQDWTEELARLATAHPAALPSLAGVVTALRAVGGVPFEVIAGTPAARYGARITFRPGGDPVALAGAAGLSDHPWGVPDWIGVRTSADGTVRCKAYHRRPPRLAITTVHRGLPPGLDPVMAARDGDAVEVYALCPGERSWRSFVSESLAPLPRAARAGEAVTFSPVPRPARRGFAVSARHEGDVLSAITVYAFPRSLPRADDEVLAAWTEGMAGDERTSFGHAVVSAQRLTDGPGRLVGLLAWTFDANGVSSRAISLQVAARAG